MRTLLISLCLALGTFQLPAHAGSGVVERFLDSAKPPLVSYRARRTLEASALGGRVAASLVADTYLDPDGAFRFEVVREEGSGIIRERVLRAALAAEQRSRNEHEIDAAALTPANYDFRVRDGAAPDTLHLELLPKRRSKMLLTGRAVVMAEGADLLRVEGSPTELPSSWTRQVDIVREYQRINGVRVATAMRSRADVRIVGESSFSMTYAYTMINGKPVGL